MHYINKLDVKYIKTENSFTVLFYYYYWSNKFSLVEHKRQSQKKFYWPQTLEEMYINIWQCINLKQFTVHSLGFKTRTQNLMLQAPCSSFLNSFQNFQLKASFCIYSLIQIYLVLIMFKYLPGKKILKILLFIFLFFFAVQV